ncbi:MAG: quinone-interacting membrane-bound oxidoreductase complex subunit QmoC [Acidobacteria bacterium]|nr:quinone-interacting membrane-bound oxidoreductase complex subunit QmoC [Acidobacteriota bacterium]
MSTAMPLQPDLDFKRQILALGAHDLTSCYQCGTCSVVCPISTPHNPFPRKEMVWVQWGLKDLALSNSSIWLCHQCGTCTTYCPRDAKPADVMAALREYSIGHYAVPRFMGRALSEPKYLPALFAIPILIFAAILGWLGNLTSLPEGPIVFSKFMPIVYIEVLFIVALTLAALGGLSGGLRYWRAMGDEMGGSRAGGFVDTLTTILKHHRFKECQEAPAGTRPTHKEHLHRSHLLVFYGFLGLVVTTTSVGIGIYAFGYLTPWPFWHPVKILGNVSGVAVIAALAVLGYRRLADKRKAGKSTYSDWLFLNILFLTTVTGFLSQLVRLAEIRELAYPVYFVHLVFIFFLLVYFPYSKFAHLVYRTVAMLHARRADSGSPSEPRVLTVEGLQVPTALR